MCTSSDHVFSGGSCPQSGNHAVAQRRRILCRSERVLVVDGQANGPGRDSRDTFGRRAAAMVSTSGELQERPIVDDSQSCSRAWELRREGL